VKGGYNFSSCCCCFCSLCRVGILFPKDCNCLENKIDNSCSEHVIIYHELYGHLYHLVDLHIYLDPILGLPCRSLLTLKISFFDLSTILAHTILRISSYSTNLELISVICYGGISFEVTAIYHLAPLSPKNTYFLYL
jgi:hypothetical protein